MNIVFKFSSLVLVITLGFLGFNSAQADSITSANKLTLKSFELTSEADQVVFTWEIAQDIEGAKIFVERAGTDKQFEVVGQGKEVANQRYVDHAPQAGMSYYRLVIQHANGSVDYHYHPAMSVIRGQLIKVS